MNFASAWLEQRALYPQFIPEPPVKETGIIIVVPSYNETGICTMLDSLNHAEKPECHVEVIVVVNAPPGAPEEHINNNLKTVSEIILWKQQNNICFFSLHCIQPEPLTGWGVGLARKSGMDEALRRFNSIDRPEGIIVCLDADCTIAPDYLRAIENGFKEKSHKACSIYFEHQLNSSGDKKTIKAITLYELHLRYYYQAMLFTGFPDVFHTVGSAMAVKALSYMKSGGMNRKQAGEDFYFIQKLLPAGGYFSLNNTTVYPLPRPSCRVPFGTGATMEKLLEMNDPVYMTYDLQAFFELKETFASLHDLYEEPGSKFNYDKLPGGLKIFFSEEEWNGRINEIRDNTSGYESFRKRFFSWFNMFKVVKYLNTVHESYLKKKKVEICAAELLDRMGAQYKTQSAADLLKIYRSIEKDS